MTETATTGEAKFVRDAEVARGARVVDHEPAGRNKPWSRWFYFFMLAPAIILLACITLYPFGWMVFMSLHKIGDMGDSVWNDFANYIRLFRKWDGDYLNGWWLLIKYSAMCMGLEIIIGVFLAVVLNNSRWEKWLVTLFLMPMMMAPVIAGTVWYFLYNGTFGWYHWIFQSLGILDGASILGSPDTAMYGIVIVDVWQWTPLITLIVLAGLKRVPRDQAEANMVDGAGPVRNFVSITLPNLYPFLLIAILLRFMDNFRFIDAIMVMTGSGPADSTKILPIYLYEQSFISFKLGRGAAIALTLLLITIVLGLLLVRVFEDPAQKARRGQKT